MKAIVKSLFSNRVLPVVRGTLKGTRLRVNPLIKGSVFLKSYEPDKQKVFDLFLNECEVFFDIGANVGLHTYYAAKNFSNLKISSFEPLPANAAYIREAVSINDFGNVQVFEMAIGAESGNVFFDQRDDNSKGMIAENETGLKVKVMSLDDFTAETNVYPDLVKVDVEGFESDVLRGAVKMIAKKAPVFVIELHNPEQDLKVSKFLAENDFEIFRVDDSTGSKSILRPVRNLNSSWPDPDGVWGNIVAVPKGKRVNFLRG